MSENVNTTNSRVSRLSPKKDRKRTHGRLQLHNPSHKKDLIKLFTEVKAYKLYENDDEANDDDDTSGNKKPDQHQKQLILEASDDEEEQTKISGNVNEDEVKNKNGQLQCSSCGIFFCDVPELRSHCKLDWHRYNLKRKLHGQMSIPEVQFNEMIDDLSSIEGSDSEDESQTDTSSAVSRLMEKTSLVSSFIDGLPDDNKLDRSQPICITNSPKSYFQNGTGQIFGLYNSVAEAVNLRSTNNWTKGFQNVLEEPLKFAVIMVSGGHFAAAVFKGNEAVLHKTFHSYTVRAKQGGSQGTKDAKSGGSHPKSAGASLRRYNEQSFSQHVQDLLESWKLRLSECALIFFRAVSSSANVIFGGKSPPLQRNDPKLRTIPFQTKRPTLMEVKRVLSLLTVLHVYDNQAEFVLEHKPKSKKSKGKSHKKEIDRAKSRSPKRRDDPVVQDLSLELSEEDASDIEITNEETDFNELKEFDDSLTPEERQAKRKRSKPKKPKAVKEVFPTPEGPVGEFLDALTSNAEAIDVAITNLKAHLQNVELDNFVLEINQPIDFEGSNLLHLASQKDSLQVIWDLLDLGCDPSTKNKAGKFPYNLAETKESRTVFRRFMGQFPDKYDYKMAQVPAPLTEELEAEKAEKKRQLNKLKREKEKQKKLEKNKKDKELDEKDRFLKLSDREKRALAAEQRILAQCARNAEKPPVLVRCFDCACDMTGKIPFEYNKNLFCTTKCLAEHRKKFPVPLSV